MKQTRLLVNNPREVTYADAYAIYSEAFDGKARQRGLSESGRSGAMNPFESMQSLAMLWGKTPAKAFADVYGDDFKAMRRAGQSSGEPKHLARDLRFQLREGAPVLHSVVVDRKRTLDLARQRTLRRQGPKASDPAAAAMLAKIFDPRGWLSATSELDEALQRMAEGPRLADLWNTERKFAAVFNAWIALRRRSLEHNTVVLEGWTRAAGAFAKLLNDRVEEGEPPLESVRELLALWGETANRRLPRDAAFRGFSQDPARGSEGIDRPAPRAARPSRSSTARCSAIPTRAELDDVHKSGDRAAARAARHAALDAAHERRRAPAVAATEAAETRLLQAKRRNPQPRSAERPAHERDASQRRRNQARAGGRSKSRRSGRRSRAERNCSTKCATRTWRSPRRRRTRSGARTRSRSTTIGLWQSPASRSRS